MSGSLLAGDHGAPEKAASRSAASATVAINRPQQQRRPPCANTATVQWFYRASSAQCLVSSGRVRNMHGLDLKEILEPEYAAFASIAGLLVAAEGAAITMGAAVDVDHAGAQA